MKRPQLSTDKIISYLRESFWAILTALVLFLQFSLVVYGFTNGFGLDPYLRVAITLFPMVTLVVVILLYIEHLKYQEFAAAVEHQMKVSKAQLIESMRRHP